MHLNISEETIEMKANDFRRRLGIDHTTAIDFNDILGSLPNKMKKFSVRAALQGELESGEAFMDCEAGTMVLSDEVAKELRGGGKRAKFTVAHEIGHYLLGHSGNTKRSPDKKKYLTPRQKIQEQQADLFASYLLVPTSLARACSSPDHIRARFQVSMQAAAIAYERIQSVLRKEKGERRRPVAAVVDFLKEAEKQGYTIRSDLSGYGNEQRADAVRVRLAAESEKPTDNARRHSEAVMLGYTGNVCRECLSFTMVRDGNCERCNTCGASSGCS